MIHNNTFLCLLEQYLYPPNHVKIFVMFNSVNSTYTNDSKEGQVDNNDLPE